MKAQGTLKSSTKVCPLRRELGDQPNVNAIDSVTMLDGATPPAGVKVAVKHADAYIPLIDLEVRR